MGSGQTGPAAQDPFGLQRFLRTQDPVYASVLAELRAGCKRTHWMWFIFPQVEGLGSSPTSRHYAIRSREEARAYLDHPVLGTRLTECAEALLGVQGSSAQQIFGYPDYLKLQSSMTLFANVAGPESVFMRVLDRYYDGRRDPRTLLFLQQRP